MSESDTTDRDGQDSSIATLWSKVKQTTQHALEIGALQSLETDYQFFTQENWRFLVRILANIERKEKAQKAQKTGEGFNPFLPYEEDLFVADLSETHVCLLNKYNVIEHHLLMVTRAFEEQESWLNLQDFEALWACLTKIDGLAFYNGGAAAGASQRHKHLQLAPFPFCPDGSPLPIAPSIAALEFENAIATVPAWPFQHAIARFDPPLISSPQNAAKASLALYRSLLAAVGLPVEGERQTGAYNLLVTREWILIVPRSRESFQGISVNSLGFAGALLVRNQEQQEWLKTVGPLTLLQNVGCPLPE